jgi:hypothetical protein
MIVDHAAINAAVTFGDPPARQRQRSREAASPMLWRLRLMLGNDLSIMTKQEAASACSDNWLLSDLLLRWCIMQAGPDLARFVGILFQPVVGFSCSFKLISSGTRSYGIR